MTDIVRVYGRADSFDIELTERAGKWEVDVPPDLTDGVYAVQLTAVNVAGETAHWVGELFMVEGVCCFRLDRIPYWVKLTRREYSAGFRERHSLKLTPATEYVVEFKTKSSTQLRKSNRSRYSVALAKRLDVSRPDPVYSTKLSTKETGVNETRILGVEYITPLIIEFRKGCSHAQR